MIFDILEMIIDGNHLRSVVPPREYESSKMTLHVFHCLSSVKRNLLQAFSAPAPSKPPEATENMPRYFTVIVAVVDHKESNIKLMESLALLAETLQLPAGCQIRASYEVSADIARVVISM